MSEQETDQVAGFSAEWLAMREGADAKARSAMPVAELRRWLARTNPLNVIDMGCGSGSNLRWLSPLLNNERQHWQLIDNDPRLLTQANRQLSDWAGIRAAQTPALASATDPLRLKQGLTVEMTQLDLSCRLPQFDNADVITASALLDLVSHDWLTTLLGGAGSHRCAMLFALNYDGRVRFTPAHAHDAMVRDAVNRDQRRDKGFGPALGPSCSAAFSRLCTTQGYRVRQWRSDWQLGAGDEIMHARIIDDFAQIAQRNLQGNLAGDSPEHMHQAIHAWQRWRHAALADSTLCIGHVDVLALPGETASTDT